MRTLAKENLAKVSEIARDRMIRGLALLKEINKEGDKRLKNGKSQKRNKKFKKIV